MSEKVVIGSKLNLAKDIPDLMEWIEKRVDKQSKQVLDTVFLPLLAAELGLLLAKDNWAYDEPYDEATPKRELSYPRE